MCYSSLLTQVKGYRFESRYVQVFGSSLSHPENHSSISLLFIAHYEHMDHEADLSLSSAEVSHCVRMVGIAHGK